MIHGERTLDKDQVGRTVLQPAIGKVPYDAVHVLRRGHQEVQCFLRLGLAVVRDRLNRCKGPFKSVKPVSLLVS